MLHTVLKLGGKMTKDMYHIGEPNSEYRQWEVEFYPEAQIYMVRKFDNPVVEIAMVHVANVEYAIPAEDYRDVRKCKNEDSQSKSPKLPKP